MVPGNHSKVWILMCNISLRTLLGCATLEADKLRYLEQNEAHEAKDCGQVVAILLTKIEQVRILLASPKCSADQKTTSNKASVKPSFALPETVPKALIMPFQ